MKYVKQLSGKQRRNGKFGFKIGLKKKINKHLQEKKNTFFSIVVGILYKYKLSLRFAFYNTVLSFTIQLFTICQFTCLRIRRKLRGVPNSE